MELICIKRGQPAARDRSQRISDKLRSFVAKRGIEPTQPRVPVRWKVAKMLIS